MLFLDIFIILHFHKQVLEYLFSIEHIINYLLALKVNDWVNVC